MEYLTHVRLAIKISHSVEKIILKISSKVTFSTHHNQNHIIRIAPISFVNEIIALFKASDWGQIVSASTMSSSEARATKNRIIFEL